MIWRLPKPAILFISIALGLLLTGCGGSTTADPANQVVEMLDNRFAPVEVTVAAGATVTFIGAGRNPHNAVASDGSWSTADDFGGLEQLEGDEARITVSEPGTYPFFCTFHGNAEGEGMAGTLTVVAETLDETDPDR